MEIVTWPAIKAADLRIGNKVFFDGHIIDVFMLDTETIYEYYSSTCTDDVIAINKCEGIPLTRELLEKYGYVKEGYNSYRKKGLNFEFSFSGNEVTCVFGCSRCRGGATIATLAYLHQFQNLVYLLTGLELEMIL